MCGNGAGKSADRNGASAAAAGTSTRLTAPSRAATTPSRTSGPSTSGSGWPAIRATEFLSSSQDEKTEKAKERRSEAGGARDEPAV